MKTVTVQISAAGTARLDLPEGSKLCYVSCRANNVTQFRCFYKDEYIFLPASVSRVFNPYIPWPMNADNHIEVDCSGPNTITAIYME